MRRGRQVFSFIIHPSLKRDSLFPFSHQQQKEQKHRWDGQVGRARGEFLGGEAAEHRGARRAAGNMVKVGKLAPGLGKEVDGNGNKYPSKTSVSGQNGLVLVEAGTPEPPHGHCRGCWRLFGHHLPAAHPCPFPRAAGTTPVARRLQIRTDVAARSRGKMIIKDSPSRTEPQPTYGLATVQHPALDLRPADTIRRQPV